MKSASLRTASINTVVKQLKTIARWGGVKLMQEAEND